MVSTFTPNIQLEEPARGDYPGTWDTPVNSNTTVVDSVVGSIATILLNNTNVVLNAAQYQSRQIVFSSTLTGSVTITFPTSFRKAYQIWNFCTGSSAFQITLSTTAAGGQAICCPPGDRFDAVSDGTNLYYFNFGRPGSYMEWAGSSVPGWISGCTFPPYLNCDGSAFSAASYPALAAILGGTTLPDRRGTAGYSLNQGTNRITAASGGLDGNTLLATKTTQTVTVGTSNLPAYTPSGTVTSSVVYGGNLGTAFALNVPGAPGNTGVGGTNTGGQTIQISGNLLVASALVGTAQGGVSNPMPAIGTGTVYGICLIRAA